MQDNNLVPKGAARGDGRHVANRQIKGRKIIRYVWFDDDGSMRVKGGFRERRTPTGAASSDGEMNAFRAAPNIASDVG